MTSKLLPAIIFLFAAFWVSCPSQGYQILFYYNSSDGTDGGLMECVNILRIAGHHVTPIDVKGVNRDPAGDNWGAPYDQVWDMRFVDRDTRGCGTGRPGAADYFDEHWRKKAVAYLSHCGKLFIAGRTLPTGGPGRGPLSFFEGNRRG